jgi:hypothetical protein
MYPCTGLQWHQGCSKRGLSGKLAEHHRSREFQRKIVELEKLRLKMNLYYPRKRQMHPYKKKDGRFNMQHT